MNSTTLHNRYLLTLAIVAATIAGAFSILTTQARADTPAISNIVTTSTDTGATINWNTGQNGSTQVLYGTTSSYGASNTLDNTQSMTHMATLSGLTPGTLYHFEVMSGNASGTMATSSDMTFTTTNTASSTATTTENNGGMPASTSTVQIMIMKHLCNASIHTLQDFKNLGTGKGPVATLAADVLACPTTGLTGNDPVAGTVSSPRSTYNFTVTNDAGTQTLSANGSYMPHKVCETDLSLDVDSNGQISSTTCLDISHYMIPVTGSSSQITVRESMQPSGYHFGALRFTPVALDGNNDAGSLVSTDASTGTIVLNTANDTDKMVMLHVYNFQDMSTSTGGTGTTTDTTGLQAQIDALKARVAALEAEIAALLGGTTGGGSGGTTTPPTTGGGMLDQSTITVQHGGSLNFGGRGFPHEENIVITLNGNQVGMAHADGGGNFSTGSMMAPSTPGTYTYVFTGSSGGVTHATVTVQ